MRVTFLRTILSNKQMEISTQGATTSFILLSMRMTCIISLIMGAWQYQCYFVPTQGPWQGQHYVVPTFSNIPENQNRKPNSSMENPMMALTETRWPLWHTQWLQQ